MTTESHDIDGEHVPGVNSHTAPKPAEERGADRLNKTSSRWKFGLYLVIVSLLEMGALVLAGTNGAYNYDFLLPVIVLVYGVAIMTWPIVVALRVKQHTVLRIALAGGSMIGMPILILILMGLFTESGVFQWAWSGPLGIGPLLLTSLAILLHASAAFMLANFKPVGENNVQRLNNQKPVAKKAINTLERIVTQKQTQVGAIGASINELKKMHEQEEAEVKRLEGIRDGAKLVLENLPSHASLEAAKAALKDAQERGDDEAAVDAAQAIVDRATAAHTSTQEWAAHQAALKDVGDAAVKTAELARQIDSANDRLTDAIRDWSEQSAAHKALEVELEELDSTLDEARAESKTGKMDVAFKPIRNLLVSGALYTVWYGWTLSSLNSLL